MQGTLRDIHAQRLLILDFGSQYTQLIARRVRECGVYCEIYPFDITAAEIAEFGPAGVILSGGPETVTEGATPRHFQFAAAGRFVIAANQDTDTIASFFLNQETGALSFSGHRLAMGSPNFVCAPARDAMAGIVKSSSSTEL